MVKNKIVFDDIFTDIVPFIITRGRFLERVVSLAISGNDMLKGNKV